MTKAEIQAEYERRIAQLGHCDWGWSFMFTPEEFVKTARVVLVGLNPGGKKLGSENEWDYRHDDGRINAYVDEQWEDYDPGQHPLQIQVTRLFEALAVQPSEVFAANFVPFRSPSWADLPDRKGALAFMRPHWAELLASSPAQVFCSLGKIAGREIARILDARYCDSHLIGHGRQFIDVYRDTRGRVVLSIPHLSRFKLFSLEQDNAQLVRSLVS